MTTAEQEATIAEDVTAAPETPQNGAVVIDWGARKRKVSDLAKFAGQTITFTGVDAVSTMATLSDGGTVDVGKTYAGALREMFASHALGTQVRAQVARTAKGRYVLEGTA